jgi:hypothetical protein
MKNSELTDIVEKAFTAEPNFRLPEDFAQRVTADVVRREQWKSDLQEYFYLLAVVVGLMAAASASYYFLDKELLSVTLNFLQSHLVPAVFIFLIINFILLADKVLLRLLFNHNLSRFFGNGLKGITQRSQREHNLS